MEVDDFFPDLFFVALRDRDFLEVFLEVVMALILTEAIKKCDWPYIFMIVSKKTFPVDLE